MVFGVATLKEHSLMFWYLTHALDQTDRPLSYLPIGATSKRRKGSMNKRIREVEHSTFTPLVPSITRGMGRAATTFYRKEMCLTAKWYAATWASVCWEPQLCPLEELDLLGPEWWMWGVVVCFHCVALRHTAKDYARVLVNDICTCTVV